MRLALRGRQRGDTIVEVMFAIAIFAMVAVASMSIMNQGVAIAQRSLEVTQVRQQMDAQAEAIRYIHQAYINAYSVHGGVLEGAAAEWPTMTSKTNGKGAASVSQFGQTNGNTCPTVVPGEKPFILNARTAKVWDTQPSMVQSESESHPPFAQVVYNSDSSIAEAYGIWIEALPSDDTTQAGFVDFHIRSCWDAPGSVKPITLGTIVRFYDPR